MESLLVGESVSVGDDLQKHAYDEALCLAAAMAFLHKADEEEQRFFEDYRPRGIVPNG